MGEVPHGMTAALSCASLSAHTHFCNEILDFLLNLTTFLLSYWSVIQRFIFKDRWFYVRSSVLKSFLMQIMLSCQTQFWVCACDFSQCQNSCKHSAWSLWTLVSDSVPEVNTFPHSDSMRPGTVQFAFRVSAKLANTNKYIKSWGTPWTVTSSCKCMMPFSDERTGDKQIGRKLLLVLPDATH